MAPPSDLAIFEGRVPIEITGGLPKLLDAAVRDSLHRALDARPEHFLVDISRPHSELVVHIQKPVEKRLKFNQPSESEVGRELYGVISEIVNEECGPIDPK